MRPPDSPPTSDYALTLTSFQLLAATQRCHTARPSRSAGYATAPARARGRRAGR